jgi:uncharacterized protein YbjT (DUF2867 family)
MGAVSSLTRHRCRDKAARPRGVAVTDGDSEVVAAVERVVTGVTSALASTGGTGYRLRPVENYTGPLTSGP